jgi:hypothetical protein
VEVGCLPWRWSLHDGKKGNEVDGFTIFICERAFTLENLILNGDKFCMNRFHKGFKGDTILVFPYSKLDVVVSSVVIVNQKPDLNCEGF